MVQVREVEYSDRETVGSLVTAEGWRAPTAGDWNWLWQENPAARQSGISRGWVLVDRETVVGFLGNIAQEYQFGDRRLIAAVASGLVVAPSFRGSSLQLLLAHSQQPDVDLLLNTTAAPHVSKISQFLKYQRIPQPTYDRSVYWVLRARPFARAALRKKGYRGPLIAWGAPVLGVLIRLENVLRRRGPRRASDRSEVRILGVDGIDGQFDELWQRKLTERRRLFAVRNAEALRWHFADRGRPHRAFLVSAIKGTRLLGYAAIVRQDAGHLGLARARLADIFVEHDDPEIIRQLLYEGARHASRGGAAMLEVIGLPRSVRGVLDALRPFELPDESWPFLYKVRDPELQHALADEDVWYAGLFDGDGSL